MESSSIAGPSRRRRESNPDGAAADRDRHPSSDNKRRKRSGAASETATNDNSHIVGHINEDGSIEPGELEEFVGFLLGSSQLFFA